MVGFGYRSQQTGMAGLVPTRRNAAAEARAQRTHDPTTERNRNAGRPRKPDRCTGLYLWQGNKDTLYRIHGTNEPWTIGQNVSSGCIRLTNDDITDLYNRTPIGTKVLVLATAYNASVASGIVAAAAALDRAALECLPSNGTLRPHFQGESYKNENQNTLDDGRCCDDVGRGSGSGLSGPDAVRNARGARESGHQMNGPSDGAFHHRFEDAEKWAKEFDNPERDAWQKPEEILDALHLQRTSLVADIGAGTGYFSVRIAKRIPEGKIFAADIEPDMVRYLGERARREQLINLVPVQASADAVNLPEPVDVALVVDTYHHIGNRTQYFAKLKSLLRPAGRLVIVDFKADSPNGPPVRHRISPERVTQELKAAGYTLVDTLQFLPRQYCLIFDKGDS